MSHLVFIDTETTGLDPDQHEIWEVAAITDGGKERGWWLPVDLGRADPMALKISGFHDRHPWFTNDGFSPSKPAGFAREFTELTRGAHLVGAVPSFDEERLRKLLRANGQCPMWHYHIIDVEALAVGYLRGLRKHADTLTRAGIDKALTLPWRSDGLSRACGVEPPSDDERHTALGDARWVKRWYEAITGGGR